jgi:hypothetical protein
VCAIVFQPSQPRVVVGSNWSGKVLNAIAPLIPELMGGSADLAPSNKTEIKCSGDYQKVCVCCSWLLLAIMLCHVGACGFFSIVLVLTPAFGACVAGDASEPVLPLRRS